MRSGFILNGNRRQFRSISAANMHAPIRAAGTLALSPKAVALPQEHVIDVLADHDSRFKISGQQEPLITVRAGEPVRLRITAIKAKNHNRDGAVHGFALLKVQGHTPVPGWDLELKPGVQEFVLKAPEEPGEYIVVCTVICSANHEHMTIKFIVEPKAD
jgi:heme/copper-type cytochrome/quinol oxidase subunit 2